MPFSRLFSKELGALGLASGFRATVVGLGYFGGGIGVAKYLASRGGNVLVTDQKPGSGLKAALEELAFLEVELVLGRHRERDFRETDLVVASPAVPPSSPFLQMARDAGIPVTTEIALFLAHCPTSRLVAVTGSNGKSTTAAAAAMMLRQCGGGTWLGGNIGGSLLGCLDEMTSASRVVLELSSFQLEVLDRSGFSPPVAVVTNISPNHLDRHGSMQSYIDAKRSIVRHQKPGTFKVLFDGDRTVPEFTGAGSGSGTPVAFGLPGGARSLDFVLNKDSGFAEWWIDDTRRRLFSLDGVRLRGEFNLLNLLAASAAVCCLEGGPVGVEAAATGFSGVPHRLESLGEVGGVQFFNDSVSTTPESSAAALEAFVDEEVILIAGGYDKQVSLRALAEVVAQRAFAVVLIGETAANLEREIVAARDRGFSRELDATSTRGFRGPRVLRRDGFEEALDAAVELARSGSTVLLSPGCASYGMFTNFVERGERFRSYFHALEKASETS